MAESAADSAPDTFQIPPGFEDWERTQAKTFAKWANVYLAKRGMKLNDFGDDLANGVKLINLIEVISGQSLGKYNRTPKSKIQMVENLQLPINFINAFLKEVKLQVKYSAENVYDHEYRLIMGMIFCLIHKFEINDSGLDGKDGLLLWCQKNTKGYKNVDVTNFSGSWKDGLAFCALIHKFRPDLIDFDSLTQANIISNLNTAFDAAETLGIPRLLDAEDIGNATRPDDKAIMTQLAHYWKVLSKLAKSSVGKERVAAVLGRFKQNRDMATSYAARTQALHEWIEQHTREFQRADFGHTVAAVQSKLAELNSYQESDKPEKVKEKLSCAGLLRSLHAKQRVERAPLFTPPPELSPDATEALWQKLVEAEDAYVNAGQKALAAARAREMEIRRLEGRIAKLESWIGAKNSEVKNDKLGESRWETEGLLRMHEAVMKEIAANEVRATDVKTNAPKYEEIKDKAAGIATEMEKLTSDAQARQKALEAQLKKHIEEEEQHLDIAAKTEEAWANLEDVEEIVEQPIKTYSEHDVAHYTERLKDAEARLQAQSAAVADLVARQAALGDKPNAFARNSTADLKSRYDALASRLAESRKALGLEEAGLHQLDELKKQFATAAEDFDKWSSAILSGLEKDDSGELEEQVKALLALKKDTETEAEKRLEAVRAIKEQLVAAGETVGEANQFTHLTLPALSTKMESTLAAIQDKADVINSRLVAKKGFEITPAQMEELTQTFKFFDKHERGGLDRQEFAQCQESLGQELPPDQLEAVFSTHDTDKDGFINFNEFVAYMQTVMRVTDSYHDIYEALKAISGDSISADALRGMLAPEVAEFVLSVAPKGEDGNIDVKELLAMVFDVAKE